MSEPTRRKLGRGAIALALLCIVAAIAASAYPVEEASALHCFVIEIEWCEALNDASWDCQGPDTGGPECEDDCDGQECPPEP